MAERRPLVNVAGVLRELPAGDNVPHEPLLLPSETTTQPTTPTAGLVGFVRRRARNLLTILDSAGHDVSLQPHTALNRVAQWAPTWNSAGITADGQQVIVVSSGGTSATAPTFAATSLLAAATRVRLLTTATAGTGGSVRGAAATYFTSTTAGMGGYHVVMRFGFGSAAPATGTRFFAGLHSSTSAIIASANPSALTNMLGVGWDATDTPQMIVMSNDGSGTAVRVTTNITSISLNEIYELQMYAAPGSATVTWSIRAIGSGLISQGTFGTDVPATATPLTQHLAIANGALAAAHSFDLVGMYTETDN